MTDDELNRTSTASVPKKPDVSEASPTPPEVSDVPQEQEPQPDVVEPADEPKAVDCQDVTDGKTDSEPAPPAILTNGPKSEADATATPIVDATQEPDTVAPLPNGPVPADSEAVSDTEKPAVISTNGLIVPAVKPDAPGLDPDMVSSIFILERGKEYLTLIGVFSVLLRFPSLDAVLSQNLSKSGILTLLRIALGE